MGDLRQYSSAIEYYEVAMRLDPSLNDILLPAIERLRLMKKLSDNATSKGYSAESVLALVED